MAQELQVEEKKKKLFHEPQEELRVIRANRIVSKHVWLAAGCGLIPVPLVDLGAIGYVQMRMLNRLSKFYRIRFVRQQVKSFIAVLVASSSSVLLGRRVMSSAMKSIPVLNLASVTIMPVFASAFTYALGKIFIQHFESGGTFLNFDPLKVKDHFHTLLKEGETVSQNLTSNPV